MKLEQIAVKARRIHIVGGPGSGKTTLAHQLARQRNVKAYDLDEVGYEGGFGAERSSAERQVDIARILEQPGWVTEGVFLWWVDDLFRAAELVIWLDLPWRLVVWRIVSRHIKLSWQGTNRHPGWWRLLGFMRWARGYYTSSEMVMPATPGDDSPISRTLTQQYLAPYQTKLIHCQKPQDVEALLFLFSTDSL